MSKTFSETYECGSSTGDHLHVFGWDDATMGFVFSKDEKIACWTDGQSVLLRPADALQLAIKLMDWARDHMPKITPDMAAFGAAILAPYNTDEYTANAQDWGFDDDEQEDYNVDEAIEWPYCQVCGTTLVNGICPEKAQFAITHMNKAINEEWR